ncbi:DUF1631 family protein [Undibacterium luofuense]|uniref:DUF1631 family protein n=1 Tax=Undibacterium luofuense TaxID=2828733 RepID=A0A941I6M3_9BURK|nr:DUF1631 family protein [Undibacterium luofuense]MBR7781028.1 DUF1631 family protein [Undibacterium luofuense]
MLKSETSAQTAFSGSRENPEALLQALVSVATHLMLAQVDAFSGRLSNALLAHSESAHDSREASLSFGAGQLIKKNTYAYYYLVSAELEKAFRRETAVLLGKAAGAASNASEDELSLVSYEEMDKKLAFSRAARAVELQAAEQYAALNMRFASLLQKDALSIAQNPYRPEVILHALWDAWCQFDPEQGTHGLVLPLLNADILFDLTPVLHELNQHLVSKGILPDLQDSYRVRRTRSADKKAADDGERLRQFLSGATDNAVPAVAAGGQGAQAGQGVQGNAAFGMPGQAGSAAGTAGVTGAMGAAGAGISSAASAAGLQQLSALQNSQALMQWLSQEQGPVSLARMREQMPEAFHQGVAPQTLEVLSQVFDEVFRNDEIPVAVKQLISLLQIPVLKAAMLDQQFFFNTQHPARRLIDALSRFSPGVDETKAAQDPLLQSMQKHVERVTREFDQEVALFDEALRDLEAEVASQEKAAEQALQAPIRSALRKEKIRQATVTANHEVELRVGSGEIVAFVETFLENRWVKVLTLAYSVQDEKPQAVEDAIRTMDDLIWSVKPKITMPERQELLRRLPAILARLNKWLSLIKWDDADRVRFFAELAECHASIVRAPLELSPDRQLELAVEAAQRAAERRLEKRAEAERKTQEEQVAQQETSQDPYVQLVEQLERGIWLALQRDGLPEPVRVRLAWVSPMRSLYIFTTVQKDQTFSLSTQEVQQAFRSGQARLLEVEKIMDRALQEVVQRLPEAAADNPEPELQEASA